MRKMFILEFVGVLLLLSACGTEKEGEPDEPGGIHPTVLSVACENAAERDNELCYVVFNEHGIAIADANNGAVLRKVTGIDLTNGKKVSFSFDAPEKIGSVTVVAYNSEDAVAGNVQFNAAIRQVDEPLISSPSGILRGDYLIGHVDLDTARDVVLLSRISGRIGIHLEGESALVSSVERVEIEFDGIPFYDYVLGRGTVKQASSSTTNSVIRFSKTDKYVYTLPTISEKSNLGVIRIYYNGGKRKDCVLSAETGFFVQSNYSTTLTLKISGLTGSEIDVDPISSSIWISQNQGEIDDHQETYLTYKMLRNMTRSDFIPGVMAQKGDLIYVVNTQGKPVNPGLPISPTNPPCYSIEVFNIETGAWVRTIPCNWATDSGTQSMIGTPRAIVVDENRIYVAYGNLTLPYATRVAVFNVSTGDWITCIGGQLSAQLSKSDFDVDEGLALYLDETYLYMVDNRCSLRVYSLSDITSANSEKIKPYMVSSLVSNTGVPHPMAIFRHSDGTLMRTDYVSKWVYALDETKITAGKDIDVTDLSRSVDLTEGMYNDIRFNTAFEGTIPYSVASYGNTLFVAVNSNTTGRAVDGLICVLNSRWEYSGSIGGVSGYTFSKPIQVVVAGDRMIVADQNKKEIVVVQITSHTMDKYE